MEAGKRQMLPLLLRDLGLGSWSTNACFFFAQDLGTKGETLCLVFDIQQLFAEVWVHTNFNKIVFLFSKNSETVTFMKPYDE